MALFPSGNQQERIDFFNNVIKQIPTDQTVKSGLAFDSQALAKMQKALDAGDYGTFNRVYDAQSANWSQALERAQTKLANAELNYANATDTRKLSAEAAAKVMSNKETINAQTRLQELRNQLGAINDALGTNYGTGQVLIRDKNGNYVPTTEGERNRTVGRLGEPVKSVQQPDGSWAVVGQRSGTVFQGGLTDVSAAEKWANVNQSGGTADATGAFDTSGGTTTDTGASDASVGTTGDTGGTGTNMWNGYDLTGLSDEQIAAIKDTYYRASTDADLATKLQVTDADTQSFLEKAASETDPYYNQIYTRGKEDYQRGLEYKAAVRQDEMAQEALNAQIALEQTQTQKADEGLVSSGIRRKAEERLREQKENIARASRRAFQEQVIQYGRAAEDIIGSKQLSTVAIPQIEGAAIYTPATGVTGSVEREQLAANKIEADRLAGNAAITNIAALPEASAAATDLSTYYD